MLEETIVSHAIKMFKQMLLQTTFLTNRRSLVIHIITACIPNVIARISNVVSGFSDTLFTRTLAQQKMNTQLLLQLTF